MKLINLIITAVLDPSLFYSRFPFFESDKQAIEIKFNSRKGGLIESSKGKFNTRSALVAALIPKPSDGKLWAMFHAPGRGRSVIKEHSNELPSLIDPTHKGHMFTIAANKINNMLSKRKLKPIFELNQAEEI